MDALTPAVRNALANNKVRSQVRGRDVRATLRYWVGNGSTLETTAHAHRIVFGSGLAIYRACILPAIENSEAEVILVTCFWAPSQTVTELCASLRILSNNALRRGRKVRVRICLSSVSLSQKLSHTRSLDGHIYPPSKWNAQLGLPAPSELQGLDMQVKSIFVWPFSVMHSKFVLVDRRKAFLPSCNVSFENWFEGCIEMNGGAVLEQFVRFYMEVWARETDRSLPTFGKHVAASSRSSETTRPHGHELLSSRILSSSAVPAWFLPSPHHRNPHFALPWTSFQKPPRTPLNTCILLLLGLAEKRILIQTPNLTSPPVLSALVAALNRGIRVEITTSERLMRLEQLVTAGTTTRRCVDTLIKQHKYMIRRFVARRQRGLLRRALPPGDLRISYYTPRHPVQNDPDEPVQSHLKLTAVDDTVAVLGSGNMDRASWYTSQELGLMLHSEELVAPILASLAEAMGGRSNVVYQSMTCSTC